jgi:nicotinate phosphoribosyltransferase
MIALSRSVRHTLDEGNLQDVIIFASGGLDEDELARMMDANAPIDGFGVGTSLTTSSDAPALDCAYKLQEYSGIARRNDLSERPHGPVASKSGAALEPTAA